MWQSGEVDSLAFEKNHDDDWQRLAQLAKRNRLTGAESDEFIQLYQRTAGDLAYLRTNAPDPELILRISAILAASRSKITASNKNFKNATYDFFMQTLPLAFYRIRWWTLAITILFVAVSSAVFVSFLLNPNMLELLGSPGELDQYANKAFAAYYSEYRHSDFSALVWTNNAWIALQCVAGGITGIFPIFVLGQNAMGLGQAAAIMESRDVLDLFFQLILPHGQLELCSIFIAGGAGLKIFWTFINPGRLPRVQALAREGRQTILVGIGLIFVLFISGLVEGFITPSFLPWWLKILLGSLVFLAFWVWVMVCGRNALRNNISADQAEEEIGWTVEYA